jgi:multiple sugar transport system permease protein
MTYMLSHYGRALIFFKVNSMNIASDIKKGIIWFFIVLFIIWIVLPLFWMFSISVKSESDIFSYPPKIFAFSSFENYLGLITNKNFLKPLLNSLLIGVSSASLSLLVGLPAAYIMARFNFSGRKNLDNMILMTRMAPPVVILIPYFMLFRAINLLDNHLSVIIMHLTLNLSLVIWVSRGFFKEIPVEIEESALIDGASYWSIYYRIIVPLSLPLISTLVILTFLFSWNEFLFALILTRRNAVTAPVIIANFMSYQKANWGRLMASSLLIILPAVIFVSIMQKGLIRGLTYGAVKE